MSKYPVFNIVFCQMGEWYNQLVIYTANYDILREIPWDAGLGLFLSDKTIGLNRIVNN